MDPTPPDELDGLLAHGLDILDESGDEELEAFLARHPKSAGELRRRIRLLVGAGLLERDGDGPAPRVIGPYRLGACLGGGGMGLVHEAVDERLGRSVALKTIRPDLLGYRDARLRFARELEAVAKLSHPGIVPVYGAGEDDGRPWFAMERIRGATLGRLIEALAEREPATLSGADLSSELARLTGDAPDPAHPLFSGSWSEVVASLGNAIAAALDHAHRAGVLHRDVKPSNILLGLDGRPRLIDFGLARPEAVETLTRSGALVGSLPYMAPEQTRGEAVDRRTDVYGLGATLIELATLKPPFTERGAPALQRAIVEGPPPDLRARNRGLPRDLVLVLEKAIEREPSRRYLSAAEFARDLERVLSLEPVEARPAGALRRLRAWARRRPAQAVAAGAALVALVGGQLMTANANRKISRALAEALVERDRADRSRDLARDAMIEVLAELGKEDLARVPGFAPRREELLLLSVELWARLEELAPLDDGELIHAELQRERASVLDLLARHDEAKALRDRAIETMARLAEENPERAELALQLADTWVDSTVQLARVGERRAALQRSIDAVELMRPWAAAGGDPGVRLMALARLRQAAHNASVNAKAIGEPYRSLLDLARTTAEAWIDLAPDDPYARLGLAAGLRLDARSATDWDAGRETWMRAERILVELCERDDAPDHRFELGLTRAQIGDALLPVDLEESARWSRAAIEVLGPLTEEHRYSTVYLWRLTEATDTLGIAELRSGDAESAMRRFVNSVEVLDRLVELDRSDRNVAQSAALSYHNLAALQLDFGDVDAGLQSSAEAVRRFERLNAASEDSDDGGLLAMADTLHARAKAMAGEPIDPPALYERVDAMDGDSLVTWWSLAWACAEAIDEDAGAAEWAVRALGRSIDCGMEDITELEHERFAALRERADFGELVRRLE